jgi:hypothetical protein
MASILVSGLSNIETNLRIERFSLEYYPIAYPCHGIRSNVSEHALPICPLYTFLGRWQLELHINSKMTELGR